MKLEQAVRAAVVAGITLAAAGLDQSVNAGTATNNLSVSATVSNNCTINSTTTVAFGAYDPAVVNASTGADLTGAGALGVTCTQAATTTIGLDQGANPTLASTAAVPDRQMVYNVTSFLAYFLYQDAGHTTVWGNTVPTSYAYTGSGNTDTINVYGVVHKGQNVIAGAYADTVVATVNF